uniref:C2H2-type domain-containing protein n=1 Tax=Nothobranchius furzeri TaxID=105023 RepID=A0A8C6K7S9_NOTFU
MSSSQSLREFIRERLTAAAAEIFSEFEQTIVRYEEEIDRQRRLRNKELNHLCKVDVYQVVLVKEETPEEKSTGVDKQDPEGLYIKEDLWTSLEGEQIRLKVEKDAARFPFTVVSMKNEDVEDKPLFSQLHQQQMEDHDVPTSSSGDQMTAEAGGGAETSKNPDLNPHEQTSDASETDVMKGHSTIRSSGFQKEPKSFNCDHCGKRLGRKSNLNRHIILHTGQKPFTCELCGKRFSQKANLNRHMTVHTGQKPLKHFSCELCGQRFSRNSTLNSHMRIHTGQKPFACEFCGQRFSQNTNLSHHIRVHTGQKPFACELCGQRFSQKNTLIRHTRVHTGQKPFACELCGQRFSQKNTLTRHMIVHTGQKPIACELCGQRFSQKTNLNKHMRIHTGHRELL